MNDDDDRGSSSSSGDPGSEYGSDDGPSDFPADTKGGIIVPTAFDAYFQHNATRSQTSNNVFSSIIPPLSMEEYNEASASFPPPLESAILKEPRKGVAFRRMMLELRAGFNVLCYGYGSKRTLLNDFALQYCAKAGHVVVANAFSPSFSLKDFLSSISDNVPGFDEFEFKNDYYAAVEVQTKRICEFFSSPETPRDLYAVIHNIDAVPLRAAKAKACLARLMQCPRIHVIASVDHINAPLLWPSNQWLWHDLTTLQPYDFELAHADRSSIWGASQKKSAAASSSAGGGGGISETAALHVIASVTQKAKRLFVLMANRQLESEEEGGIPYEVLFNAARDDFIATNDTAFRSLLAEFRDHHIIVGQESLTIQMRKERLKILVEKVSKEIE